MIYRGYRYELRPTAAQATRIGEPLAFLRRVIADAGDACIEWPYAKDSQGYGAVKWEKRQRQAHRVALIITSGHDPGPDFDACHAPGLCHNRLCINPRHLSWGTRADNMADRAADGMNPRGERNGNAVLTEDDVRAIRCDAREAAVIARDYGLHRQTVHAIKGRRRWAHVA